VERTRIDCVGGIVVDAQGRFLMVKRGQEPAKGRWSVPGGRKEAGESDEEATIREVGEETGLQVIVKELVGSVERDAPDGSVYVIRDYLCSPVDGIDPAVVRAADDADDAGWFTEQEVRRLDCSPGLLAAFDEWGVFPGG
jgi:ADP-ribose pyrophosphatase YjhB (NUDIX family)